MIRLTESELKGLIAGSVRRAISGLNERRGYVPSDGNPIVGGYYDSWQEDGTCNILDLFLSSMEGLVDPAVYSELESYVYDGEDYFVLGGTLDVSYDESTGYGSASSPVYELSDIDEGSISSLKTYMEGFPSDMRIRVLIMKVLDSIIDKLDADDFETE